MDAIRADIETALRAAGPDDVAVRLVLAPAWTTDWMTPRGRATLHEHGIAPPGPAAPAGTVALSLSVRCPQCGSPDTREVSRFGSTACKALWSCRSCLEPFDAFKPL
jgi:ring-1,2-phenylacetyl-CoA epoxidase subunit PaaD